MAAWEKTWGGKLRGGCRLGIQMEDDNGIAKVTEWWEPIDPGALPWRKSWHGVWETSNGNAPIVYKLLRLSTNCRKRLQSIGWSTSHKWVEVW